MLGHGDAAYALHGLGRVREAVALADEDLAAARGWGAPRALGAALRVRALVGEETDRLDLLHEAIQVLEPSGAQLELARTRFALGAAQTGADARASLREALDLAAIGGATSLVAQIRETLVAHGSKPRRERQTGLGALTATERQVADLVVAGMSNAAAAEQLVVTPRTVGFHLTNVYRKLGVTRRAELTAMLAEAPER
ncbi:MAG TPA: LuxR C-terminal-related transcriptional regulator [Solirubrobacteraceae bacterium]|jgi:DNA-binding CsgD family transcriptional regulator